MKCYIHAQELGFYPVYARKPLKGENDMVSFAKIMNRNFLEETQAVNTYLKDPQPYQKSEKQKLS